MRFGINSGDVVVGKIGDDLRMDYTAQGHTVGIAQRIEQLASPDRVYVSEHTQRLVEGFFNMRSLGASPMAGTDEAVEICELEAASESRTRLDVARARGLTRFVGRGDEMHTLEAALERAREGHGQAVGVVGDPGVGKSRLCFEFVERCRRDGIHVYEAHCPAHGRNIPLLPILDLYRNYCGITFQDTPAQARQKIAGALVLLDPQLQDAMPVLFDFMGVPDPNQPAPPLDADARQRRLFALLREVFRIQAERGIVALFLVDDVHWIDPASDTFLAQMVEAVAENSRNLLLINFRPEYDADWMRRAHYHQLPLVPLGPEAIHELVESLLGRDATIGNLSERIMRWTAGNPFYTEEVINELVEAGHLEGRAGAYELKTDVDKLEVPVNVRAVLAARIDRLPESAKQLLQAASVIGKAFAGPVLEAIDELHIHDRSLAIDRLKSSDFIFEAALYPEVEYAFKHPLTQEVAYASLLQSRRSQLYGAVARTIETRAGDKLDEQAALLANHWDIAGEPGQAVAWHQRAGEWCAMTDAFGGLHHWQRVRELAGELPTSKEALTIGARACSHMITFRWRLGGASAQIERDFEDGKTLAEQAGDMSTLGQLYGAYSGYRGVALGYGNDYLEYALEAVRYGELTDDDELKFTLRIFLVSGYLLCGQWEKAYEVAETALGLPERDDLYGSSTVGTSPRLIFLVNAGLALSMIGRRGEAQRMWERAARDRMVERFQEIGLYSGYWRCHTAVLYGESESAFAIAQGMATEFEKVQTNLGEALAHMAMGEAYLAKDDTVNAAAFFNDCLRITTETDTAGHLQGAALGHLCDIHLSKDELAEARRCAEEAVAFCRPGGRNYDLQPWLALARAGIRCADLSAALEALEETQAIIDDTGGAVYQPFFHECRAAFAQAFDCGWSHDDEMQEAHRLFIELGADGHVQRLAPLLR